MAFRATSAAARARHCCPRRASEAAGRGERKRTPQLLRFTSHFSARRRAPPGWPSERQSSPFEVCHDARKRQTKGKAMTSRLRLTFATLASLMLASQCLAFELSIDASAGRSDAQGTQILYE